MGRLMDGLVGESERRAREMTRIADAIAPCVLHADEVEKGIDGVESSAHTDSGTTARVFGHLLTWLQDARGPVLLGRHGQPAGPDPARVPAGSIPCGGSTCRRPRNAGRSGRSISGNAAAIIDSSTSCAL